MEPRPRSLSIKKPWPDYRLNGGSGGDSGVCQLDSPHPRGGGPQRRRTFGVVSVIYPAAGNSVTAITNPGFRSPSGVAAGVGGQVYVTNLGGDSVSVITTGPVPPGAGGNGGNGGKGGNGIGSGSGANGADGPNGTGSNAGSGGTGGTGGVGDNAGNGGNGGDGGDGGGSDGGNGSDGSGNG